MEMDVRIAIIVGLDCGDAWPFVCRADMVQERSCGAHKAASLTRTVAWSVLAHQAVAFLIIVGCPQGTTMGSVQTWDADGFHQLLHGMAPAVVAGGDPTHMALARGLELITAQ